MLVLSPIEKRRAQIVWCALVDRFPILLAKEGLWGAISLYLWLTGEPSKELWRMNQYLGLRNYDLANGNYSGSSDDTISLSVALLTWYKEKVYASEQEATE